MITPASLLRVAATSSVLTFVGIVSAQTSLPGDRPGQIPAGQQAGTVRTETAAKQIREFAAFYGVKSQALARQLYFDLGA